MSRPKPRPMSTAEAGRRGLRAAAAAAGLSLADHQRAVSAARGGIDWPAKAIRMCYRARIRCALCGRRVAAGERYRDAHRRRACLRCVPPEGDQKAKGSGAA